MKFKFKDFTNIIPLKDKRHNTRVMRKVKILIVFLVFISCDKGNNTNEIIEDDTFFEFRINTTANKGKLEIIDKNSTKFYKLRTFFNLSNNFKKVEKINNYPLFTLISNGIIIYINEEQVDIEYQNSNNEIIKLSKEVNSYKEFDYLWSSNNWIIDYGKVYGSGKLEKDTYLHCGIKPTETNYFYKTGKWKFWDLNRKLIAEGEFEIDSLKTSVKGVGCENSIKVSRINKNKWNFFDGKGKKIEPSINLIYELENTEFIVEKQ